MIKKTAMVLIITLIITCFGTFSAIAAGPHNPYEGINIPNYDEITNKTDNMTSDSRGFVRNVNTNSKIVFKKVDFGSAGAEAVSIFAAADGSEAAKCTVSLRLDDPNSVPIVTVPAVASGWATPAELYAELPKKIKGVHDLYITNETSVSNLFKVVFVESQAGAAAATVQGFEYRGDIVFDDIAGSQYEFPIYTIYQLGILDGFIEKRYEPELGVTRGQYAKAMFRIMTDRSYVAQEAAFADVDPEKDPELYNAVSYLNDMGVVSMPDDKLFDPYNYITVTDAVVMSLRALGFKKLAEFEGGYPAGYLTVARREGILKGLSGEKYLRRGEAAVLIENVLNADYLDVEAIGADGDVKYRREAGIMSVFRDVYKGTGIISDTPYTSLVIPEGTEGAKDVVINDAVFSAGSTPAASYLGFEVDYYYQKQGDKNILVCVRPNSSVPVEVFDTSKGINISSITESGLIYVDANGEREEISFPASTRFVYNHKAIDKPLAETMPSGTFTGAVTYIKNYGGNHVVLIEQYVNIVAKSIDSMTGMVLDEYSGKSYNFSSKDNDAIIVKDGKEGSIRNISAGTVLTVYASNSSKGKSYIKAIIESNTVTGMVTAVDSNGRVTIEGEKYLVSPCYPGSIAIGASGVFTINGFNDIVAYSPAKESQQNVAVLLGYKGNSNGVFNAVQEVKVFTKENKEVIIPLVEKPYIDGVRCTEFDETVDGKDDFVGLDNVPIHTIVSYNTNADGQITVLDTCKTGAGNEKDVLRRLTADGPINVNRVTGTSMFIDSSTGLAKYPYSGNPGIFEFWTSGDPETLVYTTTFSVATGYTTDQFSGDLYSFEQDYDLVQYIIWNGKAGATGSSAPLLFKEYQYGITEEGDEILTIVLTSAAAEIKYTVQAENIAAVLPKLQVLRKGDMVIVRNSKKDGVVGIDAVFFCDGADSRGGMTAAISENNPFKNNGGVDRDQNIKYIYGVVEEKFDEFIKIKYVNSSSEEVTEYCKIPTGGIARYDYIDGRDNLAIGVSKDDLKKGDKVAMFVYTKALVHLVKYNHPDL